MKNLKQLATQCLTAYLSNKLVFTGMVRASQILGIDVYPTVGGNGVIVRSSKFWVERFYDRDGVLRWNIYSR